MVLTLKMRECKDGIDIFSFRQLLESVTIEIPVDEVNFLLPAAVVGGDADGHDRGYLFFFWEELTTCFF